MQQGSARPSSLPGARVTFVGRRGAVVATLPRASCRAAPGRRGQGTAAVARGSCHAPCSTAPPDTQQLLCESGTQSRALRCGGSSALSPPSHNSVLCASGHPAPGPRGRVQQGSRQLLGGRLRRCPAPACPHGVVVGRGAMWPLCLVSPAAPFSAAAECQLRFAQF